MAQGGQTEVTETDVFALTCGGSPDSSVTRRAS